MVERGLYTPEMALWKGPDIATAQSVVVNYRERVSVVLTRENTPSFDSIRSTPWFTRDFVYGNRYVYPSVRSRYAQVGLNVGNGLVNQIGEWLRYYSVHLDEKGDFSNSITPVIVVENHSSRPVILDKGAHLFRFFSENYRYPSLQGDELVEAVKSGLIKIQGERLGDWIYSYGQVAGRKLPRPTGIFIRINPEGRKWIPPQPENQPIWIPDSGEGYRETIDSFLKPIPEEKSKKILWIGETIGVTLTSPIDAILDTVAIRGINTDEYFMDQSTWETQLNSRLIDGGKTNWAVRVEIISATSPDRIPHFVHLRFVKGTR